MMSVAIWIFGKKKQNTNFFDESGCVFVNTQTLCARVFRPALWSFHFADPLIYCKYIHLCLIHAYIILISITISHLLWWLYSSLLCEIRCCIILEILIYKCIAKCDTINLPAQGAENICATCCEHSERVSSRWGCVGESYMLRFAKGIRLARAAFRLTINPTCLFGKRNMMQRETSIKCSVNARIICSLFFKCSEDDLFGGLFWIAKWDF